MSHSKRLIAFSRSIVPCVVRMRKISGRILRTGVYHHACTTVIPGREHSRRLGQSHLIPCSDSGCVRHRTVSPLLGVPVCGVLLLILASPRAFTVLPDTGVISLFLDRLSWSDRV